MRKAILLMLFCCSANATMYSCVNKNGTKVFRSYPCEKNEKQQPIAINDEPSDYVINSTKEKQGVDSYRAKQAPKTVAQSAAPKSLYDRAKAEADSRVDQRYEVRAGVMNGVIRAYRAEHCGANAQVPQNGTAQQNLYDRAKAEADSSMDQRSEVRAGIMDGVIRAYRAEHCLPEEVRDGANSSPAPPHTAPLAIPALPQPSVITSCDSGGCWDDVGNRYNGGGGNTYFGPSGACQMIGGMMQCP